MIKITINGRKYKGVYSWDDIKLSKYIELASIPIPEGYRDYIIADGKYSVDIPDSIDEYMKAVTEIKEDQLNVEFPAYYRKVVNCLTDIPDHLVIPDERINELYEFFFKPFIASFLYHTPLIHFLGQLKNYQPDYIRSFKIGRQRFYLPEVVNILGQDIPLANESIITYTEASDIFRGMKLASDDIYKLTLFMAIYCRKKGEVYDQKKVLERKDLFMQAPMSVVWGVFFCIMRRLPDYIPITLWFGRQPKTLREVVSEVQTYRGMAVVD